MPCVNFYDVFYVCVCVCVEYQDWVSRMRDRVVLWTLRKTSLMIMSYQALPFLWYIMATKLTCTTVGSLTRHVWIGSNSRMGDYSNSNWIKQNFIWWPLIYLYSKLIFIGHINTSYEGYTLIWQLFQKSEDSSPSIPLTDHLILHTLNFCLTWPKF
jgi:hypothetical protein